MWRTKIKIYVRKTSYGTFQITFEYDLTGDGISGVHFAARPAGYEFEHTVGVYVKRIDVHG